MIFGYERCSTADQVLLSQTDSLTKAGCERIFSDTISGSTTDRPGLRKLREQLRKGDTLVIYSLCRFSRSLNDLLEWTAFLEKTGVELKSLKENIDTSTTSGRLLFHLMGSINQFQRELIIDRTRAGLSAARARGRVGGRPKSLSVDKREAVYELYTQKKLTIKQICATVNISKPTLYKYIRDFKAA